MSRDGSGTRAVLLASRYVARCAACRGVVAKGQECAWVADLKRVWHPRCYYGVVTEHRRNTKHLPLPAPPESDVPDIVRQSRKATLEEVDQLMGDPLVDEVVRAFKLDPTSLRISERGVA